MIELVLYLIFSLLGFIILCTLAKYLLDINILVRHSVAQTKLLGQIARKQGVEESAIESIIKKAKL